jgi:spore maturation protein CgeB/predicted RNA methylase
VPVASADRISDLYRGETGKRRAQRRARERIDWLVARAGGEVLDLGCSQGIAAVLCARRGLQAVGIDIDPGQVEIALADRDRKPAAVRERLAFAIGDARALDLADGAFETVLIGNLLDEVDDPTAVLDEALRVCRAQGAIRATVRRRRVADPAGLAEAFASRSTIRSLEVAGGQLRVVLAPGAPRPDDPRSGAAAIEAVLARGSGARERRREAGQKGRGRAGRRRSAPPRAAAGGTRYAELETGSDGRLRVELPEVELPDGQSARPDLPVATILDRFSAVALRYEWRQIEVGPDDWLQMLERERPRLLFVESAWRGNGDRWRDVIVGSDGERKAPLVELVRWCRDNEIPTVFWNKEDPPNFERFIDTARLFDRVFTVDGDRIAAYQEILGHERVGLLSFGAQPRIHNPIRVPGGRQHDIAFAGTYFPRKHPDRRRQMQTIVDPAREFGVHIYSRIIQEQDPRFHWPPEYRPHLVGSVPYERMLAAYKAYKVFLNVNSVTDSPTMCARRVFELSACSTPVLSGYSRAIGEVFGDLIPVSRRAEETRVMLSELLGDSEARERRAHAAMREVFDNHTYGRRVDQILRAVGIAASDSQPSVSVLLALGGTNEVHRAVEQVCRQAWRPLQAVVALRDGQTGAPEAIERRLREADIGDVTVIADSSTTAGGALNAALDCAAGDLVAVFDPDSTYEEHFVTDLAHAFSYTDAEVVGRGADEHTYTDRLHPGTLLVRGDLLRRLRFEDGSEDPTTDLLRRCRASGARSYAADRFSFVAGERERSGARA